MEPTFTLEITSETYQHLTELEHQLKRIHDIQVLLALPREETAPALISVSISEKGERLDMAIRRIAHTLYDFLHGTDRLAREVTLVTIEGTRVDLLPLAADKIKQVIAEAYGIE